MAKNTTDHRAEQRTGKDRDNTRKTITRKGFWARYKDRLKDTHCTLTPPECR